MLCNHRCTQFARHTTWHVPEGLLHCKYVRFSSASWRNDVIRWSTVRRHGGENRVFLSVRRKCRWTRTLEFRHLNCPTFSFQFVHAATLEVIGEWGSCSRRSVPLMPNGCHAQFVCDKLQVKYFRRITSGRQPIQLNWTLLVPSCYDVSVCIGLTYWGTVIITVKTK
jgi:hypothetical protein